LDLFQKRSLPIVTDNLSKEELKAINEFKNNLQRVVGKDATGIKNNNRLLAFELMCVQKVQTKGRSTLCLQEPICVIQKLKTMRQKKPPQQEKVIDLFFMEFKHSNGDNSEATKI